MPYRVTNAGQQTATVVGFPLGTENNDSIHLHFHDFFNRADKAFTLKVHRNATMLEVANAISDQQGIPADIIRVYWDGRVVFSAESKDDPAAGWNGRTLEEVSCCKVLWNTCCNILTFFEQSGASLTMLVAFSC